MTAGQRHDRPEAEPLLEACLPDEAQREAVAAVLADKGYGSAASVKAVEAMGAEAVIPSRKSRKEPRPHDGEPYKERNKVERFFGRIKHYRRVATRYEKAVRNYESFLHVACIMTWLL